MQLDKLKQESYVNLLQQAKCILNDTNIRVNKLILWVKIDFIPRDNLIREIYRNLLQPAHCIVNLSDVIVNKCNYWYKQTLYHVIS